jgi:hypothetical protein
MGKSLEFVMHDLSRDTILLKYPRKKINFGNSLKYLSIAFTMVLALVLEPEIRSRAENLYNLAQSNGRAISNYMRTRREVRSADKAFEIYNNELMEMLSDGKVTEEELKRAQRLRVSLRSLEEKYGRLGVSKDVKSLVGIISEVHTVYLKELGREEVKDSSQETKINPAPKSVSSTKENAISESTGNGAYNMIRELGSKFVTAITPQFMRKEVVDREKLLMTLNRDFEIYVLKYIAYNKDGISSSEYEGLKKVLEGLEGIANRYEQLEFNHPNIRKHVDNVNKLLAYAKRKKEAEELYREIKGKYNSVVRWGVSTEEAEKLDEIYKDIQRLKDIYIRAHLDTGPVDNLQNKVRGKWSGIEDKLYCQNLYAGLEEKYSSLVRDGITRNEAGELSTMLWEAKSLDEQCSGTKSFKPLVSQLERSLDVSRLDRR